jgi:hypothetical protein
MATSKRATRKSTRKKSSKKTAAKKSARKKSAGKQSTRKTSARKKSSRKAAKRTLVAPRGDKRYVRRNTRGRFKESDDVSRSLSSDRRKRAKRKASRGQGDKGD